MAYDIFSKYGLDKIHDSLTENYDYKDNNPEVWQLIDTKSVLDSDGFQTDYAWYTDGEKHIFMFGDTDITEPDPDYSDWECDSETEAKEWFDSYRGFDDDLSESIDYDSLEADEEYNGNADFLNDAFNRIYAIEGELED